MARLLVRCGMMPYEPITAIDMLAKDRMGSNSGNLVYQHSVIRTLLTEENEIFADGYLIDPMQAEQINADYDAYILPLADAFRHDFRKKLRDYAELFNRLTIPVYVIGVGLRAPYEPNLKEGFAFDEDVKAFVSAVLNKSQMIGLRGQITADYLTRLGFQAETDHTVIGCPSLYTFGDTLRIKPLKLDSQAFISVNASNVSFKRVVDFLENITHTYPNHCFVPQVYRELSLTYLGGPSIRGTAPNYPHKITSDLYKSGKVKFFLNAATWFEYIKQADLSIGTRLHGNIVATINGTPNITIVQDARMRELADYHQLTAVSVQELHAGTKLTDLVEQVDFHSAEKVHAARFAHFIAFLDKNNINHIYQTDHQRKTAPLDQIVVNTSMPEAVEPITAISDEAKLIRLQQGLDVQKKKTDNEKRQLLEFWQAKTAVLEQTRNANGLRSVLPESLKKPIRRTRNIASRIIGKWKSPFDMIDKN